MLCLKLPHFGLLGYTAVYSRLQYLSIRPYTLEYTAVYFEYTAVYWGYLFAPCGCFKLKNSIVVPFVPILLHALPLPNNCTPLETNLGSYFTQDCNVYLHSNPYYVASCSPRPSFSATMTDAGTHALLKKWADAVGLRTVHRGVYSPDSTRTVSWPSLENCAWSTLDTPVALVKLTHPGVGQPHSLTDPLRSLFDDNPNLQAIVLQLHDSDARAVVEHVKKSCGGPNRGMSLYLREWEMQDGSPGIHVSGDVAAGWRKVQCKAQQVQRGHWEDTAPLYSWPADPNHHNHPGVGYVSKRGSTDSSLC